MNPSVFYGKGKNGTLTKIVPEDSEDSCLSDTDDDVDYELPSRSPNDSGDEESHELDPQADSSGEMSDSAEEEGTYDVNPKSSTSKAKNKSKSTKYVWSSVHGDSVKVIPSWHGTIPASQELKSPIKYFREFFDDELLRHIVEQSNLYSIQQNPNKPLHLNESELEQFLGCVLYMSIFGLPRSRMFWAKQCRVAQVADIMCRDRWEQIKKNLHLNDNLKAPDRTDPHRDKLYKIRPFIDKLVSTFLEIPQEQMLSVDEQMVPFKGRSGLKQYLPNKPYKWGYKIFIICDTKGLVHRFEIFTGKIEQVEGHPDLGASANIVLKLVQKLQRDVNHLIYFDNWFSSLKLFVELSKMGFPALGTIRINRFPGLEFSADAVLKKNGRGSYEEKESTVDDVELRTLKWFDNRGVTLATTFCSGQPTSAIQRWDRKSKQHLNIQCPQMVKTYNSFMGGVDSLDALIAYYRIHIRSRKWYHRLVFHFVDLVIVNSWLLYRRDCQSLGVAKKVQMDLLSFRTQIAESLCKGGKDVNARKRGRPSSSSIQQEFEKKKKRGPTTAIPSTNVRADGLHHWPVIKNERQRCKKPNCKGQTNVFCSKCHVNLCLNKHSNCFREFHGVE